MCEFNTKIRKITILSSAIVSAKSKICSPRQGYLSPGNSIVLEIAAPDIHQHHNFLLTMGLILFKLKHASNRPVCFFLLMHTLFTAYYHKNPSVSHCNPREQINSQHDIKIHYREPAVSWLSIGMPCEMS